MPDLMTPPPAGPPAGAEKPPAGPGQDNGPNPAHDPETGPGLLARLEARDRAVSAVIAGRWPHPRWFTVPLGAISLTGNYGVVWVVLAAIGAAAAAGGFSARRFAYVAGAVLVTQGITFLVKLAVRRQRPPDHDPEAKAHIPLPLTPSFPSSHASMSTVGALTIDRKSVV
jgi:membrane-associated phospholipid phosphatase